MKLFYDDIIIKQRKLFSKGMLEIPDNAVTLIKGKNGIGKTLLLKNIFENCKDHDIEAIFIDNLAEWKLLFAIQ